MNNRGFSFPSWSTSRVLLRPVPVQARDSCVEKACWEGDGLQMLTGHQWPDHSRISVFRHRHLEDLAGLSV